MLLTIEDNSGDLSFLLHKHPGKLHSFETSFGEAHVFYPKENTAALLLDVDPLRLTRRGGSHHFALKPYVNDRSYAANSLFSVALNQVFRTAVAGRCQKRPELVEETRKLVFTLPCLPSRGGEALLRKLFEPLAYEVEVEGQALDEEFPDWGESPYFKVRLTVETQLYKALRHLYVLIPVLDNEKHYWVGPEEVEKLLAKGEEWLQEHPERELIVTRYLKMRRSLARHALELLDPEEAEAELDDSEEQAEKKIGLHGQRLDKVVEVLLEREAATVADLGCGEGKLLRRLLEKSAIDKIFALDVSLDALERAEQSLSRVHEKKRERVELLHGSLLYDDERLHNVEAACLVEVIEHLEADRLKRVAQNIFTRMRPQLLVLTTPNREYNACWETLPAGKYRHPDHRFEWTRQEFRDWVESVREDYKVEISGIGDEHPEFGHPTQMAVFSR